MSTSTERLRAIEEQDALQPRDAELFFERTAQAELSSATEESARVRELEQALQFTEEVVAIVSHDLRSPISAVLNAAELLISTEPPDSLAHQIGLRLQSCGERAHRMVDNLLDYSQARAGGGMSIAPEPCDVHPIAQGVVEELRLGHPGKNIELQVLGDTSMEGDPLRIEQIISNLANNAMAHGARNGVISIRIRGLLEELVIEVHNDNADGPIPEEFGPLLYKPFHRGPSRGRGMGLGLYIVDQLARAHGGSVDVRSSDEEGTTFVVALPKRPSLPACAPDGTRSRE